MFCSISRGLWKCSSFIFGGQPEIAVAKYKCSLVCLYCWWLWADCMYIKHTNLSGSQLCLWAMQSWLAEYPQEGPPFHTSKVKNDSGRLWRKKPSLWTLRHQKASLEEKCMDLDLHFYEIFYSTEYQECFTAVVTLTYSNTHPHKEPAWANWGSVSCSRFPRHKPGEPGNQSTDLPTTG